MKAHSEPRSDTTAIVDGLKALSVLIKKTAPANEAFVIYGNAFHMARDDIDVIADYKLLHEELHQMELAWPPDIGPTVNSLSGNPNSQMLVRRHSANLRRAVAQLRAIFTKGNVDRDESKWIDNFDQLQQELEQAISAGQVADRIDL